MSALDRFYDLLNHDGDPFRQHPDNLRELQLAAMRERFAQRREQIKLLGRRAAEATDAALQGVMPSPHGLVGYLSKSAVEWNDLTAP